MSSVSVRLGRTGGLAWLSPEVGCSSVPCGHRGLICSTAANSSNLTAINSVMTCIASPANNKRDPTCRSSRSVSIPRTTASAALYASCATPFCQYDDRGTCC